MNQKSIDKLNTFTFLLPWLIVFTVFWLYPLIYAFYLSFTKYFTLTNQATFIGLENYKNLFQDKLFWKSLTNTMIFTFGTVPVTTTISIFLASLLNSKFIKFKELFKSAFFLPSVTSLVVISLIFINLYTKDGYINALFKMIGAPYPSNGWLLEPSTSLLSIMAMDVWISSGYYMVLFLAGMQTIPNDLYESAILSGANSWQRFWRITFPLLKPTLLFVIVINTIKSFQVFIEIFVMTKGGPLDSTMTLVYMVFTNAFINSDLMGYASAAAFVLFMILIVLSWIQFKLFKVKI